MGIGDRPKFDTLSILLFFVLVSIGWLGIYSSVGDPQTNDLFSFEKEHGKQLFWIGLSFVLIIIIVSIEIKFFERFAGLIYVFSLVLLLGLFFFGKEIGGATSWYAIGSMSIQPSEFAKFATALGVAKYLSQLNVSLKSIKNLLYTGLIIVLPALLIIPQPDPGSALVYAAFFFPLYREGLSIWYLSVGVLLAILFLGTIAVGALWMSLFAVVCCIGWFFYQKRKNYITRKPSPKKWYYLLIGLLAVCINITTPLVFDHVLSDRHRNRINVLLGITEDAQGVGYNLKQSLITIGHGGFSGTGLHQGSQTRGDYVPEQHTDFVFTAIAEEFGFIGTSTVVILFCLLIGRLVIMAERQRNAFTRTYGYAVAGIFFIHFFINIGMVMGLLPTIGIPLPFMSYGGSGLWGFTILLFIFIKFDAHRMSYEH